MNDWAVWLQTKLDALGWTPIQAAANLGVSLTTMQDWLAGKHLPQPLYRRSVEEQMAAIGDEYLKSLKREPTP
jgi:hypothetical protein